jgi:hypothetical protein
MRHTPVRLWFSILALPISALAQEPSALCRERAATLRQTASECRNWIAGDKNRECDVAVKFRNGAEISIEAAESLAGDFEARAKRIQAAQAELNKILVARDRDVDAIKNIGFATNSETFEQWNELSQSGQSELRGAALRFTFELAVHAAKGAIRAASKATGSFQPFKQQKLLGWLKQHGIENETLWNAIRAVAKTKGKPAMAAALNELLDQLVLLGNSTRTENAADVIVVLVGAVGIIIENPEIVELGLLAGIFAADANFALTGLVYLPVSYKTQSEIRALTQLSENNLSTLKSLSQRVKDRVVELKAARRTIADVPACA